MIAKKKRAVLWERQKGNCHLCGLPMNKNVGRSDSATFDHIIPRSKGGSNHIDNIKLAHGTCNHQRGDRPVLSTVGTF